MALEKPCKIWAGAKLKTGYGQRKRNGKNVYVHIEAYVEANGPVPAGMEVSHLCHQPSCWESTHLTAETHAENNARKKDDLTCRAGHLRVDHARLTDKGWLCRTCANAVGRRGYARRMAASC